VREARLSAGAGFLMLNCGDIMTMPGLLKALPAMGMDLDEDGRIVELS
jgi:formate--tetrahydrofolate ligase